MKSPSEDLTERTLFHLALCDSQERARDALGEDVRTAPPCSSWAELLAAVIEGLERDWVAEAYLCREDGETQLTWSATERGDRAMRAFRARMRNSAVEGEEDEA